jgi:hypothetical protein
MLKQNIMAEGSDRAELFFLGVQQAEKETGGRVQKQDISLKSCSQ